MKKSFVLFVYVFLLILCMPVCAFADMGPKPSVNIEFVGADGKEYYATLLSKTESTGPYYIADESKPYTMLYQQGDEDYDIWLKFKEYNDSDGYYFLQYFKNCTQTNSFKWIYYPPSEFKILLYYPQEGAFAVSEKYERYAFDSYFKVDISNVNFGANEVFDGLTAIKSYDYTGEIISLVCRIVLTILIEIATAFVFGFRRKKQLAFIGAVNVFTQTALNVALNISNYKYGQYMFVFNYIWLELLVAAVEFAVFSAFLKKTDGGKYGKGVIASYAAAANIISFVLGLWLAKIIPGIF
jgi:hypothetical protein